MNGDGCELSCELGCQSAAEVSDADDSCNLSCEMVCQNKNESGVGDPNPPDPEDLIGDDFDDGDFDGDDYCEGCRHPECSICNPPRDLLREKNVAIQNLNNGKMQGLPADEMRRLAKAATVAELGYAIHLLNSGTSFSNVLINLESARSCLATVKE